MDPTASHLRAIWQRQQIGRALQRPFYIQTLLSKSRGTSRLGKSNKACLEKHSANPENPWSLEQSFQGTHFIDLLTQSQPFICLLNGDGPPLPKFSVPVIKQGTVTSSPFKGSRLWLLGRKKEENKKGKAFLGWRIEQYWYIWICGLPGS